VAPFEFVEKAKNPAVGRKKFAAISHEVLEVLRLGVMLHAAAFLVECDNGRDAAGYRAIIHDDDLSFVHGKVQNAYRYSDTLGLMTQLGATPGS
jgi:hypothetical protein